VITDGLAAGALVGVADAGDELTSEVGDGDELTDALGSAEASPTGCAPVKTAIAKPPATTNKTKAPPTTPAATARG